MLAASVLAAVLLFGATARAEVDIGFFYGQLAPYGEWGEMPRYGWVWFPGGMPVGWRPYTTGRWVYTEEGPTWLADEDWGWITFHYGRWGYDPDVGWFWVPDTLWAPAWVAWRCGEGFIGWAPVPPLLLWDEGMGFPLLDLDDIDDFAWCFTEERKLFAPRAREVLIVRGRNRTLLRRTEGITRFKKVDGRVIQQALDDERVRAWSGALKRLKLLDRPVEFQGRREELLEGGLAISRPPISPKPPSGPPRNVAPTERRAAPLGYDREREELLRGLRSEHDALEQWQRREIERGGPPRERDLHRMQMERLRMQDYHNRDLRQLRRRYPQAGPGEE